MDQLFSSWADAYNANIFYNYIKKDRDVECILVICTNDEVVTFRGASKALRNLSGEVKIDKVARLIAQSAALQEFILPSINEDDGKGEDALDVITNSAMGLLIDNTVESDGDNPDDE